MQQPHFSQSKAKTSKIPRLIPQTYRAKDVPLFLHIDDHTEKTSQFPKDLKRYRSTVAAASLDLR